MKKIIYITLVLTAVVIAACTTDEGNAEEAILNSLNAITITDLETSYTVKRGDVFNITPTLADSQGSSNKRYVWRVFPTAGPDERFETGYDLTGDAIVLSNEKDLSVEVDLTPTNFPYLLEYYVYDDNTDVFTRASTELYVSSNLARGVVLLSKLNGESTIDFIGDDGTLVNEAFKTYNDGESLGINPKQIEVINHFVLGYLVYIVNGDGDGGKVLDAFTFEEVSRFRDLFTFDIPDNFNDMLSMGYELDNKKGKPGFSTDVDVEYFEGRNGSFRSQDFLVVFPDRVQHQGSTGRGFNDRNVGFGEAITETTDDPPAAFNLHKDILPSKERCYAFDKLSKRILRFNFNPGFAFRPNPPVEPLVVRNFPDQNGNVGSTVLMDFDVMRAGVGSGGDGSFNVNAYNLIVKNQDNSFDLLSLPMDTQNTFDAFSLAPPTRHGLASTGVTFTEESLVAFSINNPFTPGFYYVDGTNIGYFDAPSGASSIMASVTGEVTAIYTDHIPVEGDTSRLERNVLYVATYGGSGRTGTLYEFTINNSNNSLTLVNTHENVAGRIVDLDRKYL